VRPQPHRRAMPRWLGLAALLVPVAALASQRPAVATDSLMRAARTAYPAIAGTRLDSCDLCHVGSHYALDAYGRDYNQNRRNFQAIEGLDSDGDGFSNLAEIQALTFPGKADDYPGPSPTPTTGPSATPIGVPSATFTHPPSPPPSTTPTRAPTHAPTRTPTAGPTVDPGVLSFHIRLPFLLRKK
jgi:hypothetical protein